MAARNGNRFIDGAFSSAPISFQQVLNILTFDSATYQFLPVGYIVTDKKLTDGYTYSWNLKLTSNIQQSKINDNMKTSPRCIVTLNLVCSYFSRVSDTFARKREKTEFIGVLFSFHVGYLKKIYEIWPSAKIIHQNYKVALEFHKNLCFLSAFTQKWHLSFMKEEFSKNTYDNKYLEFIDYFERIWLKKTFRVGDVNINTA